MKDETGEDAMSRTMAIISIALLVGSAVAVAAATWCIHWLYIHVRH